jgi:hypothetical protein
MKRTGKRGARTRRGCQRHGWEGSCSRLMARGQQVLGLMRGEQGASLTQSLGAQPTFASWRDGFRRGL